MTNTFYRGEKMFWGGLAHLRPPTHLPEYECEAEYIWSILVKRRQSDSHL